MNPNKTVAEALKYGKAYLKANNIESYRLDAEVILMNILKFSKVQLFCNGNYILNEFELNRYLDDLTKRANKCPVQYIIGKQEFMSLDFKVNEFTLIPRHDTETLVETILNYDKSKLLDLNFILEIGTGTGCITISLLKYCEKLKAIATDISCDALKIADLNSSLNSVNDRVSFIESDLFNSVPNIYLNKFDAVISNPPYIETNVIEALDSQVKNFEPLKALDGGEDGLSFYRLITKQSYPFICEGGFLFYEIGYNQADKVKAIMEHVGFKFIEVIKDLNKLDRVVVGKKC